MDVCHRWLCRALTDHLRKCRFWISRRSVENTKAVLQAYLRLRLFAQLEERRLKASIGLLNLKTEWDWYATRVDWRYIVFGGGLSADCIGEGVIAHLLSKLRLRLEKECSCAFIGFKPGEYTSKCCFNKCTSKCYCHKCGGSVCNLIDS